MGKVLVEKDLSLMEMAGLGEEVAGDGQAVDVAGPSGWTNLVQAVEGVFGVLSVE